MKDVLPVAIAGGTFAGASVIGLIGGVVAATRSGEPLWAPAGLLLGAALGGYAAVRVILRSLS